MMRYSEIETDLLYVGFLVQMKVGLRRAESSLVMQLCRK